MLNQWEINQAELNHEWYENEERGKFRMFLRVYLGETGNIRIRPLKKGILSVRGEKVFPQIIRHK